MSKTGTTTLGECFEILGLQPHATHQRKLKRELARPGGRERLLLEAKRYRSFEDSPWYHLYREFDERFPGSKFILTTRIDGATHATSAWNHQLRKGRVRGQAPHDFVERKTRYYQTHNEHVRQHFHGRPADFLEVCWERGDDWRVLCDFLEVPVPDVPFPHKNARQVTGSRSETKASNGSFGHMLLLRARARVRPSYHELRAFLASRGSR